MPSLHLEVPGSLRSRSGMGSDSQFHFGSGSKLVKYLDLLSSAASESLIESFIHSLSLMGSFTAKKNRQTRANSETQLST